MAPKYLNKLQNQRILVIGGTAGIEYAVAEGAIEFGATVTVASSQQENVDKAVKNLKESYPDASDRINGYICNTNSDDVEANMTKALDFATNNKANKLDHIVDTAGGTPVPISVENAEPSQIQSFVKARVTPKMIYTRYRQEVKTLLSNTIW